MEVQTDLTYGTNFRREEMVFSEEAKRRQNLQTAFIAQLVGEVPQIADEDKIDFFQNTEKSEIVDEERDNNDAADDEISSVSDNNSLSEEIQNERVVLIVEDDLERQFTIDGTTSAAAAKLLIASEYGIDPVNVKLTYQGVNVRKVKHLGSVSGNDPVKVELTEDLSEEETLPPRPELKLSFVKVKCPNEDGTHKYLEVAVFDGGFSKQYCGGYRNKVTGQLYYHAYNQTDYYRRNSNKAPKMITRETQTFLPRADFGTNTDKSEATQTCNVGATWDCYEDRALTPRKYVPYDQQHKTMIPERAVAILQRAWRRYLAKKSLLKRFEEIAASQEAHFQIKASSLLDFRKRQITLLINTSHPTGRGNFSNLHMTVNQWVQKELKEIRERKSGFALKTEYLSVLKKEVEMLFNIETLRIRAKEENLRRQDARFLEGTARSRARVYPNGNVTLIDDLNVQKARIFKEMFANYSRTDVTTTERIEIITGIRHAINETYPVHEQSFDLIELLDREIDLLLMGLDEKRLTFLRERFKQLFLDFARKPEINPQARYYRKSIVPDKRYALYKCSNCSKIKPPYQFFKHLRMKKFTACMSCAQERQNTTASVNLAPYARILDFLRKAELDKKCRSSVPFLLQPLGTHFIVNTLWNGKCIASGSEYLPELRLTRWLPNQDWTMWNTILLTEREAWKHGRIEDPLKHYDEEFVMRVRNRNILGRMHFDALVNIDRKFVALRNTIGYLPKDHLLYTNPGHAKYIPKETP